MKVKNLKNNSLWVSFCSVCGKGIVEGADMCFQNMDVTINDTTTVAVVFFHPECEGEFRRRFPGKEEGTE